MTQILRQKYHLKVSRNQVMILLRNCDLEGSASRQRRRLSRRIYRCSGPNGTWHIDGYDTMKPSVGVLMVILEERVLGSCFQ